MPLLLQWHVITCHSVLNRLHYKGATWTPQQRHCIYLDELQAKIYNMHSITVSQSLITCILYHLCYSYKHVSTRVLEWNDLMCSAFINKIADQVPNSDMLIFTNEAICNRRASAQAKGWSLVERRCIQRQYFICGQRFSILPILILDGIVAYDIILGSVNLERFVKFLCELVVHFFFYFYYV